MMQPMMMVTILPVVLAMVPGVELNWLWASVPLTNVALAMKEIVKGTMDFQKFLMILFSSSVIAALLLAWCRSWFNRDEVLFRDWPAGIFRRKKSPPWKPGEAIFICRLYF
jgi:sodium transport system permease protein